MEKILNISIICGIAVMLLLAVMLAWSYVTPDDSLAHEQFLDNHPLVNGAPVKIAGETTCVSCHQDLP